jgi:hypothetical protein
MRGLRGSRLSERRSIVGGRAAYVWPGEARKCVTWRSCVSSGKNYGALPGEEDGQTMTNHKDRLRDMDTFYGDEWP